MSPQTETKVALVKADIASGMTTAEACKKHTLGLATYYANYKAKTKKSKKAAKVAKPKNDIYMETIKTPHSQSKLVCLIGDASEISNVLKGL